jgi:hypothetical protein
MVLERCRRPAVREAIGGPDPGPLDRDVGRLGLTGRYPGRGEDDGGEPSVFVLA